MATPKQRAAFEKYVNLLKRREAEAERSGNTKTEKKLEQVISKLTKSKYTGEKKAPAKKPTKKGGKRNG